MSADSMQNRPPTGIRGASHRIKRVVGHPYRVARARLTRAIFERDGAIDTSVTWWPDASRSEPPDRHRYEPSGWFYLRRVMPKRSVRPSDVFVDFGSGMGRIVYLAAQYPFRRVVGVEIAPELNAVAEKYIEARRDRLVCQDVRLVTSPAQEFEVPDDMTHAFFANPFMGEVFERVIDRIVESLDRRPRTLRILYSNPVVGEYILGTGRFRLARVSKGLRPRRTERWIYVYESVPRKSSGLAGARASATDADGDA